MEKTFMGRRGWGGGGGVSRLPSKFCWLTVSKRFVGEPFCVSKDFCYGKKFRDMRGVSRFSVEIFCITLLEKFVGEPFCVSKQFWFRRFSSRRGWGSGLGIGGGYHSFVENFLSHSAEKLCMENFWYGKKVFG